MLSTRTLTLPYIKTLLKSTYLYKYVPIFEPSPFILVNAFFEPSTRTSSSFESAAYQLGGNVVSFHKDVSSIKKGESFEDTITTLSCYGHILVLRHPERGAVQKADEVSYIPVINAGDGDGEHPTQALLDLFTIYDHFKDIWKHHVITYLDEPPQVANYEPYYILLVGDILHSRTIHSLIHLLYLFPPVNIHILPYKGCKPSNSIISLLASSNHSVGKILWEKEDVDWSLYDVMYVTRLQTERKDDDKETPEMDIIIDSFICDQMKEEAIIMHPLPRNQEIHNSVDNDHRCMYFEQMHNGVYMRMAILKSILDSYTEGTKE